MPLVASLIFTLVLIVIAFYLYCKKKYSYWHEKGVKGPVPWPIVGNFAKVILQKQSLDQCIKDIYMKYKEEKLVGIYSGFKPVLLIRDPELVKHVLIKDFDNFQDRGLNPTRFRLSDNLFMMTGERWRIMRQTLAPLFTSRKLRVMEPSIKKGVDSFVQYVNMLVENGVDHEIKSLVSKFTLAVIGLCAFGLDLHTFSDKESKFSIMASKIFTLSFKARLVELLDIIFPGIKGIFNTRYEEEIFFVDLVRKIHKDRSGKPLTHNDFMDLMIEIKEQGKVSGRIKDRIYEIEIDDYTLTSQAFVFYAAGFETSSSTMSFLIYELALHPEIQDRVYEEICEVSNKYDGEINYDSIKDMKYLKMVFAETLRKYSVSMVLFRKSVSKYTFLDTNVTIPGGTTIMISTTGLHNDPKYFANPKEFNPENCSPEKLNNLPRCAFIPFGEGQRNCIGMRLGELQSMLGLATFLKQFKVEPSKKTKRELVFDPTALVVTSKEGIWVKISKR